MISVGSHSLQPVFILPFVKLEFHVCLKHLHAKGRKDDLFSDACYQQFGEELNKVLKDWQPSVLPDGECSQTRCDKKNKNGCYIKVSIHL